MKSKHTCETCQQEVAGWEETSDCDSCEGEMCVSCETSCMDNYCLNKICQQCSHDYSYCHDHQKENKYVS